MKLERLRLKNFAKFEDFEIVFNNEITHLVGINGSGKTTIGLTAIWAAFKGIAEKSKTGQLIGERFRFISKDKKSLDVEMVLVDEKTGDKISLKRHITKSVNGIKLESIGNGQGSANLLNREYIENLFNVAFLSATHFTALTGKQQAEAMGIDVSIYDDKLKTEKEQAQGIRRDLKKMGERVPVEEVERVDIKELQRKQKDAIRHNDEQKKIAQLNIDYTEDIKDIDYKLMVLQEEYNRRTDAMVEERTHASTSKKELPEELPVIDLEPIDKEIVGAVGINEQAFRYAAYLEDVEEGRKLETSLESNVARQTKVQEKRKEYLQTKTFGIKSLMIDEEGRLTYQDKLIRSPYFSKGELEMLVARIGANLNPEWKVRFIDDFELLDDDNQQRLIKNLTKKGFQIITGTVGKELVKKNSVLLKVCKVVENSNGNVDDVIDDMDNVVDNDTDNVDGVAGIDDDGF